MTERDTDIEFDFFDEPETEEATERVRLPRRPPPRGPRRPARPPAGLVPMLRLAGLIAFLILAVVLLVVLVRGCASSGKRDAYASYLEQTRAIGTRSTQVGRRLNDTLTATGVTEAELETNIAGLAAQEQQAVAQAREIDPPGPLRIQHDHLIEVLQLRASALSRLADAFRRTATARNATTSGQLLAEQARLLVASDVNWDIYFKEATERELANQGISDVGGVPDSNIMTNPDLANTLGMRTIWQRVRGAARGGTPSGTHGNALQSVTALPDGTRLDPSSQTTIVASTDLAFQVAVEDSGGSQEFDVDVTLTIQRSPQPFVRRRTIDVINPGEVKRVTFANIDIDELLAVPTTLKVDVEPVPGEARRENNSQEYRVIFSLG
jgi:hypothetical protein